MQFIDGIVEIAKIQEMMPNGVTQPFRCRTFQGDEAIVKFEKNQFGATVLLNELIGHYTADLIGVNIPQFGICYIGEETVGLTDFYEDNFGENDFLGYGFYSGYIPNGIPLAERVLHMTKNCDVNKIILLDCILNNEDRHDGNLLITMTDEARLYSIDFSHIISRDIPWSSERKRELFDCENLSVDFLKENADVYSVLFRHKSYSADNLKKEADNIKEKVLKADYQSVLSMIPQSWTCKECESLAEQIIGYIKGVRVN